jgi:hypothetical protein
MFRNSAASSRPLRPVATIIVFKPLAKLINASGNLFCFCLLDFESALPAVA